MERAAAFSSSWSHCYTSVVRGSQSIGVSHYAMEL